jgi:hypothetical protein
MPKRRGRIPTYVEGPDGRPLAGAQVLLRTAPAGVDALVYAARDTASSTQLTNPLTTGANGRVPGFLERGEYTATVTATGMDPYVEDLEVGPAADDSVDADWLAGPGATGAVATRQADGSVEWAPVSVTPGDGTITRAKLAPDADPRVGAFQGQLASSFSLASAGTYYVMPCRDDQAEGFDFSNWLDANGRFTPQSPGRWLLWATLQCSAMPSAYIRKNGTDYKVLPSPGQLNYVGGLVALYFNGTTDYAELVAQSGTAGASCSASHTRFGGHRITS